MTDTPALATDPKIILFTDWDGTVTVQDSNDYLTDNLGMGIEKRRQLNKLVLEDKVTFRDSFREMLESVKEPFDECVETLIKNVQLDPGFKDFYLWAKANNIPIIVLSSGMIPIIKALLNKLVGPDAVEYIEIIANDVDVKSDGSWEIVYRDESHFGHDKSRAIKPYATKSPRPVLLYAGDGVSDLSAASETDLLFAKEGRDLITYCKRENIRYCEFSNYAQIFHKTKELLDGTTTVEKLAETL